MATPNLGLTKPTVGGDPDAWGGELNTDLDLIDARLPKIAFSAYLTGASQSISNFTWTKVSLGTEEFDVGSYFDNATNYRFTPLVAGYYQINGRVSFGAVAAGGVSLCAIYKNGSRYKRGSSMQNEAGTAAVHASVVSDVVYLNGSTDYVELYCIQTSGGSVNIDGSTTEDTFFNGAILFPA